MGDYRMCLCFTRRFRHNENHIPQDVKDAFQLFTGSNGHMSAEQLYRFMMEFQGEADTVLKDAEAIVERIRLSRHFGNLSRPLLSLEEFHHFLFSSNLNPPIRPQVHHDMTAPLSSYYIYTGHNSYLTGNQLSSDCSEVPIIKALGRGVRVIELDLWPNASNDDAIVYHGRTLTTPVDLVTCLRSIKEHAFVASTYPVIITLEDHLTPHLQKKVAEMVTRTFGDMLFTPESEFFQEFPSPETLKKRILISTKPPKEYLESRSIKVESGPLQEKENGEDAWGKEVPNLKNELEFVDKNEPDSNPINHGDDLNDSDRKAIQEAVPEYRHLITIRAGKPKGGLSGALKVEPHTVRRLSLSEQQLEKASVSHATDVVRFTQRNLLRIYPKGTRFDSSNYSPLIGWMHGAQMVAFNMQGYGRSLWLMHGMFRANGGCGYVKKPEFLLGSKRNAVFDPRASLPVKTILNVKIYMGDGWRLDFKKTHFDSYSPPDFYTRVGIAGIPADCHMMKTKIIEDNWVPVWNEEFTFSLTVPELALLRIEVHEYDMSEKDDFGGQTVLPVAELRPGIHTVPLFDKKGQMYKNVRLLMRFRFS